MAQVIQKEEGDMKVAFIGAGRWALVLAMKLIEKKLEVALYDVSIENIKHLRTTHRHPDLPQNVLLPAEITLSTDPEAVLDRSEVVVFATPSAQIADAAKTIAPLLPKSVRTLLSVSKGIEPTTRRRLSVTIQSLIPYLPVVVLAGPAIPYNVILGDPTSLVAVSENEKSAQFVRDCFTSSNLRVYYHTDVVGVEIAASFKNVVAIAAGISDGLGLDINAKAALLTRGLAEITRLGLALNANPLTFSGLAGMGDLIVTAFSPFSRNHQLGLLIGKGQDFKLARKMLNGVAEGATTVIAGLELARQMRVEMPITEEVNRILYQGTSPQESIRRLLNRPLKKEFY
ncbi:MAG: NAD(P)H-dependent glycerol-3-phosphate dehydrogenase [bacterium]